MFKFVLGPIIGPHEHLTILETSIFTILGMMTSVVVVTFIGEEIRQRTIRRQKRRGKYRVFTRRKRRIVRLYQRFGMKGIAFLTPLILTPIGGTIVAVSFGVAPVKIIYQMFISSLFWGPLVTFFFAVLEPLIFSHI